MIRLFMLAMLGAMPALAQQTQEVSIAPTAMLRGLDRLNGNVVDFELATGQAGRMGKLQIRLGECRYPQGNPTGDAFAHLTISEEGSEVPVFAGWMIASAPALNPLDHARYDVWVLRCKTE